MYRHHPHQPEQERQRDRIGDVAAFFVGRWLATGLTAFSNCAKLSSACCISCCDDTVFVRRMRSIMLRTMPM
jgi:hypothetical protein